MSFDINLLLNDMSAKIKEVMAEGGEELAGYFSNSFQNHKTELEKYAKQRIKGEISNRELKFLVKQRKLNIENDMLAASAYTKAVVQKAVNSALDVFYSAIEKFV